MKKPKINIYNSSKINDIVNKMMEAIPDDVSVQFCLDALVALSAGIIMNIHNAREHYESLIDSFANSIKDTVKDSLDIEDALNNATDLMNDK